MTAPITISQYFITHTSPDLDLGPDTDAYQLAEELAAFRTELLVYYGMSDLPATEENLETIQAIEDKFASSQMDGTTLLDDIKASFPMEVTEANPNPQAPTLDELEMFITIRIELAQLPEFSSELQQVIQEQLIAFREAHPSYVEERTTLLNDIQTEYSATSAPTLDALETFVTSWLETQLLQFPSELQELIREPLADFQAAHPGYTEEIGNFNLHLLEHYQIAPPTDAVDNASRESFINIAVKLSDALTPMKFTALNTLMADIATEYPLEATEENPAPTMPNIGNLETFITGWLDSQPQFPPILQRLMSEPLADFQEVHPNYTEEIGAFGLNLLAYYQIQIPSSTDSNAAAAFASFSGAFQGITTVITDSKIPINLADLMTNLNTQYPLPTTTTYNTVDEFQEFVRLYVAIQNITIEDATTIELGVLEERTMDLTKENLYTIRIENMEIANATTAELDVLEESGMTLSPENLWLIRNE